jgi:competence protein ComEC
MVKFGHTPNHLLTEARSLLDADTSHQVRLLGIQSNHVTYYQALNYNSLGTVVFESIIDSFIVPSVAPNDVFRMTMIDVRQGDSFLLMTPAGYVIVIDGGYGTHQPPWGGAWTGDGYPFALEYLQNQGINHVDHMVETHNDMDHWGGLRDIQNAMPVDNYYSPESPGNMTVGQSWDVGDTTITATVLSLDYPPGVPQSGDNNRSIVLRFAIGQVSFLLTGDAEEEVELWEVATYGNTLQSTILKVGHHGSSSSTTHEFLDKVRPDIALISCGADNPYGHPHDEILDILEDFDVEIFRTDLDGNITIRTDGAMTLEISY